ncbi:MAG: T9SS type A sorting domain-containing protein [Bacteroidales bacterium]|nr:T9SS type A sorting domain-containing protein [Bacteroidales bacterium]
MEIEGFVRIEGSDIRNLSGLNSIVSIGDYLRLQSNDSLTSLSGLENLIEIDGALMIGSLDMPGGGGNPMLSSFTGLDNLLEIGGSLCVCLNDSLVNFEGLGSLRRIGYAFFCARNYYLLNFVGLEALDSLGDYLFVGGNYSLQDFSGLEGLSRINGSLCVGGHCNNGAGMAIEGNGQATYEGLHNIEYVGGDLRICNSDREHIIGLEKISYVEGKLFIDLNDNLVNLTGLDSLQYIGNGIEIGFNNFLGMPNGNHSLNDITALMGITSVGGGTIHIEDNPMLPSLSGLDSIDSMSIGSLEIHTQNNPEINGRLIWCSVRSICEYLELPGSEAVFGGNALDPGCNNINEVEENCEYIGINNSEPELAVDIFPNPADDKLFIKIDGEPINYNEIQILNSEGRIVFHKDSNSPFIDISHLSVGLYFVLIKLEKTILKQKIIVF